MLRMPCKQFWLRRQYSAIPIGYRACYTQLPCIASEGDMCQRLAVPFLLFVHASLGYCPPNALKGGASTVHSTWLKQPHTYHHHKHHAGDKRTRASSTRKHSGSHYSSSQSNTPGDRRPTLKCCGSSYGTGDPRRRHIDSVHHTGRRYTRGNYGQSSGFTGSVTAGRRRGRSAMSGSTVEGEVGVSDAGSAQGGKHGVHEVGHGGRRGSEVGRGEGARTARKPADTARPIPPPKTQKLNVVLTHTMADFDSLAAAVGLAKLWQQERPDDECCVCIPRGTHPVVKRFLALHKNFFPIRPLKDLDQNRVFRVGLVDAQRMDRVGAASSLLANATEVHVVDHHLEQTSDINATHIIIDQVGSVSTIITERLKEEDLAMEAAEATLLALGVHSDTGSLTFDSATHRDAAALAWLMEQGASQQAVAEYGHAALSPEQQSTLTECINNLNRTSLNGATVSTALVQLDSYVNGMAAVAQNVLDVTDSDVFILGAHFPQRRGRDPTHMVLIGRARPRVNAVNLDALMSSYGGGGHRKAAAASLRLDGSTLPGGEPTTAEAIMQDLVDRIFIEQIKDLEAAEDIMTAPVMTCGPVETVEDIARTLTKHDIRGMPVVDETGKVLGLISCKEVEKVTKLGRGGELVKGWMKEQFAVVDARDPLNEVEELFIKEDIGRLPVVRDGKLVGLITRADMLRQHRFYDGLHYHNRAFATPVDSPVRKLLSNLRKTLKKYDED